MTNLIDKAIAYVNPKKGVERARDRLRINAFNGFYGASKSRKPLLNWKTQQSTPESIMSWDRSLLTDRSYDLDRNNPLASGALSSLEENIIGSGLRVQSQINAKYLGMEEEQAQEWQSEAERLFKLWAQDSFLADAKREQNFYEMQSTGFISSMLTGDVFAQRQYNRNADFLGTSWRLIDSQRVCNPNNATDTRRMSQGIERDSSGAPRFYHIRTSHPYDFNVPAEWVKVSPNSADGFTKDFIHAFRKRAIGENRGRPILAPVIEALKQLGKYTEAELQAAVVSGLFTVFVKSPDGSAEIEEYDGTERASEPSAKDYSLGNGAMVGLADGEDVTFANPARPNAGFDPFVLAILRQIGVCLGLPYELMVKHFTASYSASRAALNEAQRSFRQRRKWFGGSFCQKIYESVIIECVAKGYLSAPGFFDDYQVRASYLATTWTGDAWGSLDPVKDVTAAEKRLSLGLTTLSQETLEMTGGDYDKNAMQRAKEYKIEKGVRPNESARSDTEQTLGDDRRKPEDDVLNSDEDE